MVGISTTEVGEMKRAALESSEKFKVGPNVVLFNVIHCMERTLLSAAGDFEFLVKVPIREYYQLVLVPPSPLDLLES
jgi:hypothetical protein